MQCWLNAGFCGHQVATEKAELRLRISLFQLAD